MIMVGELNFFLELHIRQLKDDIFLSQSKYAKELMKKFGLHSTMYFSTPMSTTTKLYKDSFKRDVEQKFYGSIIGSLLYLTASRPNISFCMGACVKYQVNPKESHLTSIKRIIQYISGTLDYGLWCPFDSSLVIDGYFDVN